MPPLSALHFCNVSSDHFNTDCHSIVGVHGLGANPVHAWLWHKKNNPVDSNGRGYPTTDLNWLQELLPSKLASAKVSCRVMVYNYDSGWIVNARKQRLSNISDRMLDSLQNKRGKSDRPLIFIAHSFGGNLVERVRRKLTSTSLNHCSHCYRPSYPPADTGPSGLISHV
jgi:hypothetical protein